MLAGGDKALMFTQYAVFGGMLRAHLAGRFGREVAFLHGGVPKAERDAMVARFQEDSPSSPSLFVLSTENRPIPAGFSRFTALSTRVSSIPEAIAAISLESGGQANPGLKLPAPSSGSW